MASKKEKTKKITIQLSDEEFLFFAKEAHKKNITFNEYVTEMLEEYLEKYENKVN